MKQSLLKLLVSDYQERTAKLFQDLLNGTYAIYQMLRKVRPTSFSETQEERTVDLKNTFDEC